MGIQFYMFVDEGINIIARGRYVMVKTIRGICANRVPYILPVFILFIEFLFSANSFFRDYVSLNLLKISFEHLSSCFRFYYDNQQSETNL